TPNLAHVCRNCDEQRPVPDATPQFDGIAHASARSMTTQADQLRDRTKRFAFEVITLVKNMPRNIACDVIGRQLIRSGTSVASNYRSACRARSRREFIARLGVVLEEADETELW